jgi:hypothetical protein
MAWILEAAPSNDCFGRPFAESTQPQRPSGYSARFKGSPSLANKDLSIKN